MLMRALLAAPLLIACLVSDVPADSGGDGGTRLVITTAPGETRGFLPAEATVPAGTVSLTFRNLSSIEHNLTFVGGLAAATRSIVQPGASEELVLESLAPGTYRFLCTIHDVPAGTMSGLVVVVPTPDATSPGASLSP